MILRLSSLLASACFALSLQAQSSSKLADLVTEADVGWMVGQWTGETNEGARLQISFEWDLAKHAIQSSVKTPEWEGRGLSMYHPASEEVVYHAVDNRGIVAEGQWVAEEGRATLTYRYETPSGETGRVGVVYSRGSDGGMKLELHRVDSFGDLERPASATIKFRKETR